MSGFRALEERRLGMKTAQPSPNRRHWLAMAAAITIIVLLATSPTASWAHGPQPHQVVADFHEALEKQDKEKVLELLLPDASIFESGGAETVEQYSSGHMMGDMAFSAAVASEVLEQSKQVVGDVAWVLTKTRRTGTYKDKEIDSIGVETVVLHHVKAGWRIAHIHWSSRSGK